MSSSGVQLEELLRCSAVACVFFVLSRCNLLTEAATHKHTMSKKRHADSTQDENPPKRRQLSADQVLVEAVRNGDMTAVRAVLEKFNPNGIKVVFDAAHEACRRNDDESLVLLLPYVETTQMGFGILLSECVHADHVACTEVLLQHWKCVCKNTAFVPHESKGNAGQYGCPAMWSDPAVCRVLIDAGADLHTKNEKQRLPLQYACASGALDVVKMLLPEVDVNYKLDDCSALHYAVCQTSSQKATDVVQVLIDAGADVNILYHGYSLLHYACAHGALEIVKMLVRAGPGVRVNGAKQMFLHAAAEGGYIEIVRYLVSLPDVDVNQETVDVESCTALHRAVIHVETDVVQVLIDAGADIDTQNNEGRSPLLSACAEGTFDTVKMLVRAGAKVRATDDEGVTCLHYAARRGHTEAVRYLVCLPEVDVNHRDADNNTALHFAVVNANTYAVQVLIDAGADINTQNNGGRSPLHSACASRALDVVEMLVEAGAGVRAKSDDGDTCLILAAYFGHTETVRYLVGLPEVELNYRDTENNYTALQHAVEEGYTDVVQVLIDAGADVDTRGNLGRSPLLYVCASGELDVVKMLVRAGAGVRATDDEGDTCLILAAFFGHTETVRYLVGLPEVELNHRDTAKNYTALQYAVQEDHKDVAQVLIDALYVAIGV